MSESRAYTSWKRAVEAFKLIALAGVPAVGVRDCETNLAAAGAFVGNYLGEIHGLLRQEQERITDDVNLAARSDQEFIPCAGGDVGPVCVSGHNLGRGRGAWRHVRPCRRPQVALFLADQL